MLLSLNAKGDYYFYYERAENVGYEHKKRGKFGKNE